MVSCIDQDAITEPGDYAILWHWSASTPFNGVCAGELSLFTVEEVTTPRLRIKDGS